MSFKDLIARFVRQGLRNGFQQEQKSDRRRLFGARLWADAYLAAFAMVGTFRLVTFDRDFTRFSGLELLHLKT